MIQYINILTKDGKSLLFRNYGTSEVDRDLLAGFLSAFSGFMKEISQSDIKSTQTEDFKYFYTIIDTIIIVVCTDLIDDDSTVNSKILSIRTRFIEQYGKILKDGSWAGNRTIFYDFEKELDNLILGAIKISILGFGGVGKTTLTRLICGQDVDLEYVPTITADIASYEGDEFERSITLWDFAGQAQFRSLWKSLLQGSDICLLVTDSTFENINESKEIIHDILDKHFQEKLVIGIANKQDLPNRLTPKFCERILASEERLIKTHGMSAIKPMYREKILAILREAIKEISRISD
ncbi:MAG: GTP-binding protein [Candidatus Lokiarchaeota archaeon]|nr:GTP-binding protein [Candidatus Lokiarchaeota archaeon]